MPDARKTFEEAVEVFLQEMRKEAAEKHPQLVEIGQNEYAKVQARDVIDGVLRRPVYRKQSHADALRHVVNSLRKKRQDVKRVEDD